MDTYFNIGIRLDSGPDTRTVARIILASFRHIIYPAPKFVIQTVAKRRVGEASSVKGENLNVLKGALIFGTDNVIITTKI